MLRYRIKASSVTNLTDARYFAAKEVDFLGFCLDEKSSQYLSPMVVKAIKEWVEGPKIVVEFGNQSLENILIQAKALDIETIQINDSLTLDEIKTLSQAFDVILELNITDAGWLSIEPILEATLPYIDYFILNFEQNNIENLSSLCQKFPVLLQINAQVKDVFDVLEKTKAKGLVVVGGEEERVGVKSFDELDEIFELLEEDEA